MFCTVELLGLFELLGGSGVVMESEGPKMMLRCRMGSGLSAMTVSVVCMKCVRESSDLVSLQKLLRI